MHVLIINSYVMMREREVSLRGLVLIWKMHVLIINSYVMMRERERGVLTWKKKHILISPYMENACPYN